MSNDKESYKNVCVWELKNFNRSCVGVELWSPVFLLNALGNSQWRIALCLDNYDNNSSYFFNFRLKCVSDEVPADKIDCELSILDSSGSPLQRTQAKNCDFLTFGCCILESLKVAEDIFGLNENKFFPYNTLTVRCRMQKSLSRSSNCSPELRTTCMRIERSSFMWTLENFSGLLPFQKSRMNLMQKVSNTPVISFEFFFDDYERFQVKVSPIGCNIPIDASFKISILDVNRQMCKTEDFSLCKSFTSLSLKRKEVVDNKTLYLPMDILSLQVECFFTINENAEESNEQFSYQELYAIRDAAKGTIVHNAIPPETPAKDSSMTDDNIILDKIPAETPAKDSSMTGDIIIDKIPVETLAKDSSMTADNIPAETPANTVDDRCTSRFHREFFRNLYHLYEKGLFTDTELHAICGPPSTFAVHRNILSARIPALVSMFMNDPEPYHRCMLVDSGAMRRILLYAYSDRIEENLEWMEVFDFYLAAQQFSIGELAYKTAFALTEMFTALNVCDILQYAILHNNDDNIVPLATEFILSHGDEVIGSDQWDDFKKYHVQLSVEILKKFNNRKLQGNSS